MPIPPNLSSVVDFHTHNMSSPFGKAIINLPMEVLESGNVVLEDGKLYSVGIFPLYEGDWENAWMNLQKIAVRPQIAAIGECGLDKRSRIPLGCQMQFFDWQMALSVQLQKPLIIHCVRAWQELLKIHDMNPSSVMRIVHGFRGKPELAEQLISNGFYLSFGLKFNDVSLRLCPPEFRLAETDAADVTIEEVLQRHFCKDSE